MVFHGIDRLGRGLSGGTENLVARCLSIQCGFRFGDAARERLGAADAHMGIDASGRIRLSEEARENGMRPAVSYLFRSVARHCGSRAIGILLTGMGRDGAEELKLMKDRGALTVAQDADSSVVHGMPGWAIRLGAADRVLPPAGIAELLRSAVRQEEQV